MGVAMAILALVVALDAFAGYPQGFLLGLVSAGAWALYRAWGAGARFLVRCGVAVALGLLLASVQLLPFIEYARHSAVLAYRAGWLPPLHASAPVGRQPPDAVLLRQPDRR